MHVLSNLIIIIITILSLGSSSNCFVIRNLVTVIFQAKEQRPYVLNEKSSDQGPQRLHKKMPIYIQIYSNQVLKYVALKTFISALDCCKFEYILAFFNVLTGGLDRCFFL
jgi:hypothetical protein